MRKGIVACPVHGDNETTKNCPNCRPFKEINKDETLSINEYIKVVGILRINELPLKTVPIFDRIRFREMCKGAKKVRTK